MNDDRASERDDRGQLILVTGLAVAVTLVAMVLLLNTVIYTQNLATRGAQIEDGEALAVRGEVVADVGGLLDAENREDYDSQQKVEDNVTGAVARYDHLLSRYHGERGTVAEIERESLSLTEGVILRQTNASRNFTNETGEESNWTLAEDVGNSRNVRLTVSGENLSEGQSDSFHVQIAEDSGPEWRIFLYNDTGDDDIVVAVKNESDSSATEVCSVSGPEATVDLTRGTINGTPCPGLVWAAEIDAPYNVTFRNGEEATGAYEMTLDAPETAIEKPNFADPSSEESPRWGHAAYAAEFEIHFETPRLVFHTTVRTAPGEPR